MATGRGIQGFALANEISYEEVLQLQPLADAGQLFIVPISRKAIRTVIPYFIPVPDTATYRRAVRLQQATEVATSTSQKDSLQNLIDHLHLQEKERQQTGVSQQGQQAVEPLREGFRKYIQRA